MEEEENGDEGLMFKLFFDKLTIILIQSCLKNSLIIFTFRHGLREI